MGDDQEWLKSLNPYTEMKTADAISLIKQYNIDYSVCFYDEGLCYSWDECIAVNDYFQVKNPYLTSAFSKFSRSSGEDTYSSKLGALFYTPSFSSLYDEKHAESKNVLIWLTTHYDKEDFVITSPIRSSWQGWEFFMYLQGLGYMGYNNIFVFLNVCYSKAFSQHMWGEFVDMKAGMTLVSATRHFFMHKHIIPIDDNNNAVQQALTANAPYSLMETSQRARRSVASALSHSPPIAVQLSDEFIEYVYIPKPGGS
ncbi:MAG: hypothetical protein WDN49_13235 [Acetobacteraceae bacterium]